MFLEENTSYLRSQYGGRYEDENSQLPRHTWLQGRGDYAECRGLRDTAGAKEGVLRRVASGWGFPLAHPTHGEASRSKRPYVTVGEAIMDIARAGEGDVPNHVPLRHGKKLP